MMNCTCLICSELLISTSEIFSTSCGHMFHQECLIKWLQNSKTCPHCRHRETITSVHRIYLNFASSEGIVDDAITLQARMDMLNFDLSQKNKELAKLKAKYTKSKETCDAMREFILKSKEAATKNETTILALKKQLDLNREHARHIEQLTIEAQHLKETLDGMQDWRELMSNCKSQVDDMLHLQQDSQPINIFITTLKKQLVETDNTNRALTAKIMAIGKEMFKYLGKMEEFSKCKEKLHQELIVHDSCSSEIVYLRHKLLQIRSGSSSTNCTITSALETNNSAQQATETTNVIDLTSPIAAQPSAAIAVDDEENQSQNTRRSSKRRKTSGAYTSTSKLQKLSSNPSVSKR